MSDLLSRCKLFNALAPVQTLGEAYGVIQGMETEDAEYVKHGQWIEDTFCSECGWCNEVEPGFIGSVNRFNFCPNCGARMDGKGV